MQQYKVCKGNWLPSPAEDRGLQRKTWLRRGCAKRKGKRDSPQQEWCLHTRQGSWVIVALHVLINSGHLPKCSTVIDLLGRSPELCCCCLAMGEKSLGTTPTQVMQPRAPRQLPPHQPCTGKGVFSRSTFLMLVKKALPSGGLRHAADNHAFPGHVFDPKTQWKLCFRPAGSNTGVCQQS